MFQEILYSIVGSWGRAAIQWMLANPSIVGVVLLVWMGMLFLGKVQLKRIESRTSSLVLEVSRQYLREDPLLRADQLYGRLYPQWSQMVRSSALFIPHRWELWPLPATPSIVRERIDFTPEWLSQYLRTHGFDVRAPKGKSARRKSTKPVKTKKRGA